MAKKITSKTTRSKPTKPKPIDPRISRVLNVLAQIELLDDVEFDALITIGLEAIKQLQWPLPKGQDPVAPAKLFSTCCPRFSNFVNQMSVTPYSIMGQAATSLVGSIPKKKKRGAPAANDKVMAVVANVLAHAAFDNKLSGVKSKLLKSVNGKSREEKGHNEFSSISHLNNRLKSWMKRHPGWWGVKVINDAKEKNWCK